MSKALKVDSTTLSLFLTFTFSLKGRIVKKWILFLIFFLVYWGSEMDSLIEKEGLTIVLKTGYPLNTCILANPVPTKKKISR